MQQARYNNNGNNQQQPRSMAPPAMRNPMPVHGATHHVIHSNNGAHMPDPNNQQQVSPPQQQQVTSRSYCSPQWGLLGLGSDGSSLTGIAGDAAGEDQVAFRQQLRRGFDLTQLGIDVIQEMVVKPYTIFSAPCDDNFSWTTPEVALPECYKATPPPLEKNFANFAPDTLMYIFYAVISEQHQVRAALELYNRHKMYYLRRARTWARDNDGALELFNPKVWQFAKSDQATLREDAVPLAEMEDLGRKLFPTAEAAAPSPAAPPAGGAPAVNQDQRSH